MLESVTSDLFAQQRDKCLRVIAQDETFVELTVKSVRESVLTPGWQTTTSRKPFAVILHGHPTLRIQDGMYKIDVGGVMLEGVFINQVQPADPGSASAFQIIFS